MLTARRPRSFSTGVVPRSTLADMCDAAKSMSFVSIAALTWAPCLGSDDGLAFARASEGRPLLCACCALVGGGVCIASLLLLLLLLLLLAAARGMPVGVVERGFPVLGAGSAADITASSVAAAVVG